MLTPQDIANRFGYHKGTDVTVPQHQTVRQAYAGLALVLSKLLPEGRAKSVALTQLEDSAMWANKAVAEQAPLSQD